MVERNRKGIKNTKQRKWMRVNIKDERKRQEPTNIESDN